jgi:hypothetical protein
MSDDLSALLRALDIAAFRRNAEGAFSQVGPLPGWFGRLVEDATFPFLGHVLEEAVQFWTHGAAGRREWGPSVEVNDVGREFHYRIAAVTTPAGEQYLVFQLDPGSERLRDTLQTVRQRALEAEMSGVPSPAAAVRSEVRQKGEEIHELLRRLLGTAPTEAQFQLWSTISASLDNLMDRVDTLTSRDSGPGAAR